MAERASTVVRAADDAALSLHQPGLSPGDVVGLLEHLVRQLRLADDVTLVVGEQPTEPPDGAELVVPLRLPTAGSPGDGRPGGPGSAVLRCQPVDDHARRQVEVLIAHAQIALAAIERMADIGRREDAARRVAERLQDSLLPDLPTLPHTRLAVAYRAAAREARVGGDFYDVFPLPDGRVLTVVGDVMGKGVEAASRTSQITQTLRALALQGLELDVLLERVDEQVTYQDPEIMATLWCGLYEPSSGEVQFAGLGHPPPLLLRPDGRAVRLELAGLPLGMRDLSPEPPECRDRRLAPRDLLVLYTDGVVETSGDFVAGQEALLDAVRRRRDDPLDEVIDGALAELLGDAGHTDDAVMLLLRRV